MRRLRKDKSTREGFESRMIGVLASLVFSVPTAFLLWFWTNTELALIGSGVTFISSNYLWGTVLAGSIIAFFSPDTFINLIAGVWHWMLKLIRWWG